MHYKTREMLSDALLEELQKLGGTAGNKRLREAIEERVSREVSVEDYEKVRDALIDSSVLGRGRGKGGSVFLVDDVEDVPRADKLPDRETAAFDAGADDLRMNEGEGAGAYAHSQKAIQRPDVGVEPQFHHRRPNKSYRYDSSLAPELCWDESPDREFAEWLVNLIATVAEHGDANVFSQEQIWLGTGERFSSLAQCAARLRSLTQPFLNWAGKAERRQISVPTLPLFVHERHSTQAILETLSQRRASQRSLNLFGDPEIDITDKLDAYQHKGPWTNRMVLGDSLHVMNSLLEYEGMGGQVQMIYIDPPYGVKFGSNFQPFVRKRDVKHGADDEMIREPEMVKAYRDTWELGLHSYLTYLRDRLLLARELLTESGSVFVQISDENLHHVREVLDEIFGENNCCSVISFSKTSGFSPKLLSNVADYILWYAKDVTSIKYNQIFLKKEIGDEGATQYNYLESIDGAILRSMTAAELKNPTEISSNYRVLTHGDLSAQGSSGNTEPFAWNGKIFRVPANCHWKTTPDGMKHLASNNRLMALGNSLRYKRYLTDFALFPISNLWTDTGTSGFSSKKLYTVQTNPSVIERCMLMTTDPGDLVLDPTCGSGTTAYVAEQWGRRWITCDTSRVPLALARQRLLTATFPWYELDQPSRGPAGGFVYTRKQNRKGEEIGGKVPRITLKSIANNEDPEMVTLVDKPEINTKITRVCGAFTVEATIQAAQSLEIGAEPPDAMAKKTRGTYENPRRYLDRMIEVLRQSKSLRLPGNEKLDLAVVRPLADSEYLHAEATAEKPGGKRIAIAFGPEDGAIGSEFVYGAAEEARQQAFDQLFLFGFAIQAKARELLEKLRFPTNYVSVTPDVVMADLLKTSKASEIFSISGLPDVALDPFGKGEDGVMRYQVRVNGLDIFRPDTMETESLDAGNLPCWMLDTNYNGMVFCASQVFFPRTSAWDNLQKSLRGRFDDGVWEHLAGTESEPFALGDRRTIAVKVIDDRGNELMVVKKAQGAGK